MAACLWTALALAWPGPALAQPLAITGETNSRLFSLNPDTGASLFIGNTGVVSMTDLARAPDGNVFASSLTTLYGINPSTAAVTSIGTFGTATDMVGLEFSAGGVLYGVSAAGSVYQINRNTGSAAFQFDTAFAFEGDIAHEVGNSFYATASAGAGSRLVALDVLTQAATDRGLIAAGGDFPGLDFANDGRLLAFSSAGNVYNIPAFSTSAAGVFLSSTSVPIAGITLTPVPEPSAIALVATFACWARGRIFRRGTARARPADSLRGCN
jgi:outer membrane protein assembly factor BamB